MRKIAVIAIGAALSLALVVPGAASAQSNPPLVWTTPVNVEHAPFANGNTLFSVSCPSTVLCVTGDTTGTVFTSTGPADRLPAWTPASIAPGKAIISLTCPIVDFCLALAQAPEGGGPIQVFTSWSPTGGPRAWVPIRARIGLGGIACPVINLCVTGGAGQIIISTNPTAGAKSVWKVTAQWPALSKTDITGMACPSESFCVGVDVAGDVYTSSNPTGGKSAWTITDVDGSAGLVGVSCPSASFCASLDSSGRLFYSTNPAGGATAWHHVTAPANAIGISCLRPTFCTALDGGIVTHGNLDTTTNPAGGAGAWNVSDVDGSFDLDGVSCASTSLCVAVDSRGDVLSSTNPGGGAAAWRPVNITGFSAITSIDCPAAALCVAGDNAGNIISSFAPGGRASAWFLAPVERMILPGPANAIDAISCPGTRLCVAVDSGGNVLWATKPTENVPAWQAADIDGSTKIDSVTCPTTSLCVAADSAGNVLTSTNPTGGGSAWHTATVSTAGDALHVACPTTSLCLASGDNAIFASTNPAGGPSAWHPSAQFVNADGIGPITCHTASFCIAVGQNVFDNEQDPSLAIFWSSNPAGGLADWQLINLGTPFGGQSLPGGTISCPTRSFCLAEFGPDSEVFVSQNANAISGGLWEDAGTTAAAVSCVSKSFCVAGDDGGDIQVGTTPLATTTAITSVTKSPVFGQPVKVSVRVAGAKTGKGALTPGGTAIVSNQIRTSCRATLSGTGGVATGSCALLLPDAGPATIVALYPSQSPFGGSGTTTAVKIDVARARSTTALKLSAKRIAFGQEQGEHLKVTVRPQFAGAPTGTVIISVKGKTICTLRRLVNGVESCALTARQLRPGTYRLIARYSGNNNFIRSTSATAVLTIFRPR